MKVQARQDLRDPNPHLGALISSYQDGNATPEETRLVEEHLFECEICRSFYASLQQMRELIQALPDPALNNSNLEVQDYYKVMSRTVFPVNRKRAKKILRKERKK